MNHCRPPQNWSLECGAVQIAARQKSSQTTDGQYLIRFCKVLYRTLVILNYTPHGSAPSPYYLSVTSTPSGAAFATTLGSGCNWLSFAPGGGVTPVVDLYVALNTAVADGLAPSSYNCTITANVPSLSGGLITATIPVRLTITTGAASSIAVSPASWTLLYPVPPGPPQGTPPFSVGSLTGSIITPTMGPGCNWLNLTDTYSWDSPVSLSATINTNIAATLKPGSYSCMVTFTAAPTAGTASLALTLVILTPATASTLTVSPPSMAFNYIQHGGAPPAYFMSVTSTNSPFGVSFTTALSSGCNWLDFTPGGGATPAMIIPAALDTVFADSMSPGTYTCTITVTAPGTSGELITTTVPITLTVAAATISVYPTSWTFNYPPPVPPTGTPPFSVRTSIGGLITPSLGAGCNWLSLTGTPDWFSPVSLNVGVNTSVAATLQSGSYPCAATFTAASVPGSALLSLTLVVK